ncbi:MAG: retention module-containing protein, partial [Rhodoferax sp.]
MAHPHAVVVFVKGPVFVFRNGQRVLLKVGDAVQENEVVITGDGGQVELRVGDGDPFRVGANREFIASAEVLSQAAFTPDQGALAAAEAERAKILEAVKKGLPVTDLLEATAGGESDGGGSGGHDFIRLVRVVEEVASSSFTSHGLTSEDSAQVDPVEYLQAPASGATASPVTPTITAVTAEIPGIVTEGASLVFNVTLSAASPAATTHTFTLGGTASGADLGALAFSNGVTYDRGTGLITVPANVSSFSVTVPTVDDTTLELPETVSVTVGGMTAVGGIVDNDVPTIALVTTEAPIA